jgi:hypothetical protein
MALLDDGWTEEQAQGLWDGLNLSGSVPDWKPEHLQRLYDWCSARRKNHKTIEATTGIHCLRPLPYTSSDRDGTQAGSTREAARKAVEPYLKILWR